MQRCLLHPTFLNTHHFYTHPPPLTSHHTPICCFNSKVLGAHAALSPSSNAHPHSPHLITHRLFLTAHHTPMCSFISRVLTHVFLHLKGAWGSCSAFCLFNTHRTRHFPYPPFTSHRSPRAHLLNAALSPSLNIYPHSPLTRRLSLIAHVSPHACMLLQL
jgi:hypothetical protein